MKTSVNLPDDLYRQVVDIAPELPFAELVRDALVTSLPGWQADRDQGQVVLELNIRLRAAQAAAGPAAVAAVRRQRRPRRQDRPAAGEAPAPASPPAHRKPAAPRSKPKAATVEPRPARSRKSPARSPRS